MIPDMAEIEARVQNGLTWLKTVGVEHGLDIRRMSISSLNASSGDRCALVQAAHDGPLLGYRSVRAELLDVGAIPPSSLYRRWDADHGFWEMDPSAWDPDQIYNIDDSVEQYAMLDLAWIRALRADPVWCDRYRDMSWKT